MTTSEEFWLKLLDEQIALGNVSADGVFQDYLTVRGVNNEMRGNATEWLFKSFEYTALRLTSDGFALSPDCAELSSFSFSGATLSGPSIAFPFGVRKLTCEVGSIKAPGDGIIKGGGIAIARISHFGMPEKEQFLRLVIGEETARWVVDSDRSRSFDLYDVIGHFRILIS